MKAVLRNANTFVPLISFCVLFSLSAVNANGQQITVGKNIQVSRAWGKSAHTEVLLAADPTNVNHLIGGSMLLSEQNNKMFTSVYASFDGGKTWASTLDTGLSSLFSSGSDPSVAYGPDGSAYFSVLVGDDRSLPRLRVYRSKDGGKSWSTPYIVPATAFTDRPYIIVDDTGGKYNGRIYVTAQTPVRPLNDERSSYAITLFRSLDGGVSFDLPTKRAPIDSRSVFHLGNNVVLADGTLVSIFTEIRRSLNDDGNTSSIRYFPDQPNAAVRIISSDDGGESLSSAVTVSNSYVNWPKISAISSIPYLAVDRHSNNFKDRFYAVWPDSRSGRSEILFSYSRDKGKSWSRAKVVNDDRPFNLNNPAQGPDDFLPVVTVNREGVVGLMWYDRRDNPDNLGWNIRFTASLDGGDTFLPSVRVSEVPNKSCEEENWALFGATAPATRPKGNPLNFSLNIDPFCFSGGHTAGMAADANGAFHPLWIDNRTGTRQVWTASVSVGKPASIPGLDDLSNLEDISEKVNLEVVSISYDKSKNAISAETRLRNISKSVVNGPIKVKLIMLRSGAAVGVNAVNADNNLNGVGAVWNFTVLNDTLSPEQVSETKKLIFRLIDRVPLQQGKLDLLSNLINFNARVYGKTLR